MTALAIPTAPGAFSNGSLSQIHQVGRVGAYLSDRQAINGILRKLRSGAPRRDIPERYGEWKRCHERLRRWSLDATWDRLLEHVQAKDDAVGEVGWEIQIDSSVEAVHQHAARGAPVPSPPATQNARGTTAPS